MKWQQEIKEIEKLKQAEKERLQQAIQEAENLMLEADVEEKKLKQMQGKSKIPSNQEQSVLFKEEQLVLIRLNQDPMNHHAKMLLKTAAPDWDPTAGLYVLQLLLWAENQRRDIQSTNNLSELKRMPPHQAMQRLLGEHFLPTSTRRQKIERHVQMFLNEDNTWQAVGILRKLLRMQARGYPW